MTKTKIRRLYLLRQIIAKRLTVLVLHAPCILFEALILHLDNGVDLLFI